MKILHVITSLQTGGAEKLVSEIVPAFRAMGHEVDVALFNGVDSPFKKELEKTNCKIISFSEGGSVYSIKRFFQLLRIAKNYDIIHTHNSAPQYIAALVSIFVSAKYITTEHNTTNRRREWKWYPGFIDRWMYGRYSNVICISDKAYDNLLAFLGKKFPVNRIVTIYNGVNIERFISAQPIQRAAISSTSTNKSVITMVAGFRPQKDQDTLIRAFTLLPDDKYEMWFVGDGERRAALEQKIKEEKLNNIHLLGVRNDIPEVLHSSDIIVLSSHYEGLSLSSIEGMCVGKPFIASDVDGLHEIVQGAGLLFKDGDYKALANIIEELMQDTAFYEQVAASCLDRAKRYDINIMIKKYNDLYY